MTTEISSLSKQETLHVQRFVGTTLWTSSGSTDDTDHPESTLTGQHRVTVQDTQRILYQAGWSNWLLNVTGVFLSLRELAIMWAVRVESSSMVSGGYISVDMFSCSFLLLYLLLEFMFLMHSNLRNVEPLLCGSLNMHKKEETLRRRGSWKR